MLSRFTRAMAAIALPASLASGALSQIQTVDGIPRELWGKWTVVRELDTRTISCWGDKQAKRIIGTTIDYSPRTLSWRNLHTKADGAKVRTVTADEFHQENSGGSVSGSQIDFQQLGIKKASVTQITIRHPDQSITGATSEFPGDEVLVKAPDTLVFSLCNVYFEAKRVGAHSR
jgi:hypothetical protein